MNPIKPSRFSKSAPQIEGFVVHPAVVGFLICTITLAVFWPVLWCDYVNLDDPVYVTENLRVLRGLSWDNLRWAFTNLEAGFWQPLVWLSYMLDVTLFGKQAGGMHLTNLLLHLGNSTLLFLLLRRLTGTLWRSAVVAALFALHPLHVEPVAWIASRKDVLSTFFGFGSLLFYACYAEKSKIQNPKSKVFYLLSLAAFLCGLMSKTMVVTIPVVMLLLDWWPLQRIPNFRFHISNWWRLVLEKLPFFAAGLVSVAITMRAEKQVGAISSLAVLPLDVRFGNGLLSYVHYLWQTVWPVDMAVSYPYPREFAIEWVVGAALLLVVISVVLLRRSRQPHLVVGWIWYVVVLLPVIGLVQVGPHSRADRYTYVPLVGIFIAVVWGMAEWMAAVRCRKTLLSAGTALVLVVLAILTRIQLGYWQNSGTLLQHAVAVTKDNALAHNNLGAYLAGKGQLDEAVGHYRRALEINSREAQPLCNLANVFVEKKQFAEAFRLYDQALLLEPDNPKTLCNYGLALIDSGKVSESTNYFLRVLARDPGHAGAHDGLGRAFARMGRTNDAFLQYAEALRFDPDHILAHIDLGVALAAAGKTDEAIPHYRAALQLAPDNVDALNNLGLALASQGRLADAASLYQAALRTKPNHSETHNNLGIALRKQGQLDASIAQFREALRLKPDDANALNNLGFALETQGNQTEAIIFYRAGLQLKPEDSEMHYNLANVFVETGKLDAAIEQYQAAIRFKPDYADAHCNLGVALKLQGRPGEAVAQYQEALRLNSNHGMAHNNLGKALAEQGRLEQAVQHYQASLRQLPDYPLAHFNLGVALAQLGRRDEAIQQFRETLRLKPGFADAQKKLQELTALPP